MYFKKFKNGNINIHPETGETFTIETAIEQMANSIEIDFVELLNESAPIYYGNFYAVYGLNIGFAEYHFGVDEMETLNSGRVVKLRKIDDLPQILIPSFYDYYSFELGGVDGVLFKLCDKVTPEKRAEFENVSGVQVLNVSPQYAPEIKRAALFVPRGVNYWYE